MTTPLIKLFFIDDILESLLHWFYDYQTYKRYTFRDLSPHSIEIDANEAYCIHFVLYDDKDKAAATVRLLPNIDLSQVTLQRMAVLDTYQGQGLGSILLKEAEDFAQEQGFQTISLHAQLSALKFYLNNGYQEVGNIFEEAGIQHITVEKSLISKKA